MLFWNREWDSMFWTKDDAQLLDNNWQMSKNIFKYPFFGLTNEKPIRNLSSSLIVPLFIYEWFLSHCIFSLLLSSHHQWRRHIKKRMGKTRAVEIIFNQSVNWKGLERVSFRVISPMILNGCLYWYWWEFNFVVSCHHNHHHRQVEQ